MRRIGSILIVVVLAATGCNQMAQQPSSRANEGPQMEAPDGAIAFAAHTPLPDISEASEMKNPLEATTQTIAAGRLAYRRYCWPCHGPDLDGEFSQVGPSFPAERLNILEPDILSLSDGELFVFVALGTGTNPPLLGTMTETELWETITYIRAIQSGKTKPGAPEPGRRN